MTIKKIDNNTTIYIVDIENNIKALEERITLSSSEFLYYSKITAERRRCEWLTSRILIKEVLGDSISTDYKDRAPILIGSDKHISISHSRDKLALIVSNKKCGIDIEKSNYDFSRVSKRFLSVEELSFMTSEDIALSWCIKEAAYKLIGVKEIDFSSMFIIKSIDYIENKTILIYNKTEYTLYFFTKNELNICYSIL